MSRPLRGIAVGLCFVAACSHAPNAADDVRVARRVVVDIDAGRIADVRKNFDDVMDAQLPAKQLAAAWNQFVALKGRLLSQGTPEVVHRGKITVVNIPLRMSKGASQARISFDSDGKIAGLYFLQPGVPVP